MTFCLCDTYDRYMEIPVVSRIYFSAAFLTTAGCAMDLINPYYLYYNFDLIFFEGQVWRLFSSFLFFGLFSVDFLFNMYFLVSKGCMLYVLHVAWKIILLQKSSKKVTRNCQPNLSLHLPHLF